ncbi:hypothetical protein CCR75_001764 [Bremia lactucae]|uniref:Chromo domain-containing protein n=1 Tax=Bremia lactucae TaxID=4779 RepID=A0A976IGK8_BRELC|nr:hypothetical protein CCR75_001764 [Bremia lactucae]
MLNLLRREFEIENVQRQVQSFVRACLLCKHREQQVASNHRPANFEVREFVLWSRIDPRLTASKLTVRWVGPFAVEEVKEHSFLIKNILTGSLHDVHGSQMKRFSENHLSVTDELREHVANQGLVLGVSSIDDLRYNKQQLKVSWAGLEEEESSWEPLSSMRAGGLSLGRSYLNNNAQKPEVVKYRAE